ncbi:MAG: ABC transporter ATP-binding protein [Anaerolineae bacterium]|nr:ABC transporter ATP-binding protein [Anaerolineae bacterium]
MTTQPTPMLQIEDLKVHLPLEEGVLKALDGVTLTLNHGQTLGLVGESGCGKSMTAQSIMRIAPRFAQMQGRINFHRASGQTLDLASLDPQGDTIRSIRGGEISMIFQEPMTSFSPLYTIGNQIIEAIRLHRTKDPKESTAIAEDMLARVGIPDASATLNKYPQQLSGGMRQRAMIAMALSCRPALLIADEPTTALDVTVQAQVLKLMRGVQAEFGMSILYITHDLGVIARMVSEVAVMYLGRIVEQSTVDDLFYAPRHPYTQALLKSIPRIGKKAKHRLESIQGSVPVPINTPTGCGFVSRCPVAIHGLCDRVNPPLVPVDNGHSVRCFLYPEVVAAAQQEGAVQHVS